MKNYLKNHWIVVLIDAGCVLLAAFAVLSVFLPDNVTSHPEYHRWIYKVVSDGNSFRFSDFLKSFDVLSFDWVRPRFIDYLFIVFNVKLRLFLYYFFIPFTNLSLHFFITLIGAPILFYKFAQNFLGSSKLAFYSTTVYITSVGFLSNLVTLFQPAKALAHVAVLALYLLMSILIKKNYSFYFDKKNYKILSGIFLLNLIGISIDEGYLVMAAMTPIIFYPLFIPKNLSIDELRGACLRLSIFFLPFLLFLIFVATIAPKLVFQASGVNVDFIEWISDKDQEMSKNPFLPFVHKNSTSLLASSFSPIFLLGEKLPIMLKPVWNVANAAVYILFCLAFIFILLYRFLFGKIKLLFQKRAVVYFWKSGSFFKNKILSIGLAILLFLIFQSFLMKMHPVVSGAYYYSSLFSILTSLFIVLLFGRGRVFSEDVIGRIAIVILIAVQLTNFYDINSRWKLFHENWIYLESSQKFTYLLKSADLINNESWLDKVGLTFDYKNKNGLSELDNPEEHKQRMRNLWVGWKNGEKINMKSGTDGFTNRDALFLHEMDVLINKER